MSVAITYELNGISIEPPISDSEVVIEMRQNSEDADKQAVITQNDWSFGSVSNPAKADAVKIINTWIDGGGINEGLPFEVFLEDKDGKIQILNAHLRLNAASVIFSCDFIKNVPSEIKGGLDWFVRRTQSINFRDLYKEGFLTFNDTICQPYVNSTRPNYKEAAIVTVTAFITISQVRLIVKETSDVSAEIGSVISAISGVIKAAIVIGWLIILVASTIEFIKQVGDLLLQPVKYHTCMKWKRLIEALCEKLELELVSSIFDDEFIKDTVIMPPKFKSYEDPNFLDILGFTKSNTNLSAPYYAGTAHQLLIDTKTMFRATITLTSDGKLIIEPKDSDSLLPAAKLPNIKIKESRTNQHQLHTHYELRLLTDDSDVNTTQHYKGTVTHAKTTLTSFKDESAVILGGDNPHKIVQVNLTRGIRKNNLNSLEKKMDKLIADHRIALFAVVILANVLVTIRNAVVFQLVVVVKALKFIGIKVPFDIDFLPFIKIPPIDAISSRVGVLLLEDDSTSQHKVFAINQASDARNTKLRSDNNKKWGTEYIYNTYHSGQSFVPTVERPFGNQKDIYEASNAPIPLSEIRKMINNNRIFTFEGDEAELISFLYRGRTSIAERIVFSLPKIRAKNLKLELETPDGL